MLLIGLAARGGDWMDRASLAALLYPHHEADRARVALRQSLRRLRSWLGEGELECEGNLVRLPASVWKLEIGQGEATVAPGLDHPWIDRLRAEWFPSQVPHAPVAELVKAVERTALLDRDVGRAILVGGQVLTQSLKIDTLLSLLAQTHFNDRRDPHVTDHLAIRASAELEMMAFAQSAATHHRMTHLARHIGNRREIKRCVAVTAFLQLEMGDVRSARQSVSQVGEPDDLDPDRLLVANCRGCYYWNMARYDEALEEMRRAMRFVPAVDRMQRLHYINNYAVLAAEAGRPELAFDLLDQAQEFLVPEIHVLSRQWSDLARHTAQLHLGLLDEAIEGLQRLSREIASLQRMLRVVYCDERLAEAHAKAGDLQTARSVWLRAESRRRSAGAKLNPRIVSLRARALSAA